METEGFITFLRQYDITVLAERETMMDEISSREICPNPFQIEWETPSITRCYLQLCSLILSSGANVVWLPDDWVNIHATPTSQNVHVKAYVRMRRPTDVESWRRLWDRATDEILLARSSCIITSFDVVEAIWDRCRSIERGLSRVIL
jgi:hypothetical protein